MKRRKMRVISMVLAVIMVFCMSVVVFANQEVLYDCAYDVFCLETEETREEERLARLDEWMDNEMGVVGFGQNTRNAHAQLFYLHGAFPLSRSGDIIYPSFYGGHDFDDEGNLVLLIVESESEYASQALSAIFEDNDFATRYVEFSFADLLKAVELLDELFVDEDGYVRESVSGAVRTWGHRIEKNAVSIRLDYYNEANDAVFYLVNNSAINPDMIIYDFGLWVFVGAGPYCLFTGYTLEERGYVRASKKS